MPAGRPTKYSPKILKQIAEYMETYEENGEVVPTVEGLALFIDCGITTIYRWAGDDKHDEFRKALERLKNKQKQVLVAKGLTGDFNSAIAKLVLSANHGMHEKQESQVTGPDGGPIQIAEIKRTIVKP